MMKMGIVKPVKCENCKLVGRTTSKHAVRCQNPLSSEYNRMRFWGDSCRFGIEKALQKNLCAREKAVRSIVISIKLKD